MDHPVARALAGHGSNFSSDAKMPAKAPLQRVKKWRGHPPEIPLFDIAILYVVLNSVRKNMLRLYVLDKKSVVLEQAA